MIFNSDYYVHSKNKIAKDIWEYDNKRIMEIERQGLKTKIVWESDYKKNPEQVIKECKEFLNDTNN